MDLGQAVRSCFNKYVTFSGRAQRSEFWYFVLFAFLIGIAASYLDRVVFGSGIDDTRGISSIVSLALFLPQISVGVRRLHDTDRSGWWWWLWVIPVVGWFILLIWYVSKGTMGPNQYGSDPLDSSAVFEDHTTYNQSSIPRVRRDD